MTESVDQVRSRSKEETSRTKRQLVICDNEKCDGCGICEFVCSFYKTGMYNPLRSRIRIVRSEPPFKCTAVACRQCEDADCVAACKKAEALSLQNNVLVCDAEKCNLCCWCIEACEFGALVPDKQLSAVVACDLCPDSRIDGRPPCVVYCPKEALSLSDIEEIDKKSNTYALIRKSSEKE